MADNDKELKDQRVVTMMTPSELESIDDWMFKNRIRSRGEAIRRLCQVGIMLERNLPELLHTTIEAVENIRSASKATVQYLTSIEPYEDVHSEIVNAHTDAMTAAVQIMFSVGSIILGEVVIKSPGSLEDSLEISHRMSQALQKLDRNNAGDVRVLAGMISEIFKLPGKPRTGSDRTSETRDT